MEGGKTYMTETIQVALITGGVGVVGVIATLIGSIIQGRIANRSANTQIMARKDEQERQFEFDDKQKNKQLEFDKFQFIAHRKIEERRLWITPLRNSLVEYSKMADKISTEISSIRYRIPNPTVDNPKPKAQKPSTENLKNLLNSFEAPLGELSNSMSQISDKKLKDCINEVISNYYFIFVMTVIDIDKERLREFETAIQQITDGISLAFNRMEDLLCRVDE